MFQIHDMLLYGSRGVYQIDDICEKTFRGVTKQYYVLKSVRHKGSTIYVPADNKALQKKMRRILSPEEIYRLIKAMPYEDSFWIENESQRKETYRKILSDGNRLDLVRMIKALYQHRQELLAKGKKLHSADDQFFREGERLLYEEFALVLHIRPEQVLPFIMEQLNVEETPVQK